MPVVRKEDREEKQTSLKNQGLSVRMIAPCKVSRPGYGKAAALSKPKRRNLDNKLPGPLGSRGDGDGLVL